MIMIWTTGPTLKIKMTNRADPKLEHQLVEEVAEMITRFLLKNTINNWIDKNRDRRSLEESESYEL